MSTPKKPLEKETPKKPQETKNTPNKLTNEEASRKKHVNYKKHETFNLYIFKVLKQVHPNVGMSKKGMSVMNAFVYDIFDRIACEAGNLVYYNKKSTIDSRAIQCAVKLCFPLELSKHAH